MAHVHQPLGLWLLYDMAKDLLVKDANTDTIRHVMSFLCGYELKDWEVVDLLSKVHAINKRNRVKAKELHLFADPTDSNELLAEKEKTRRQRRIDALITKSVRYGLSYKHKKKKLNSS